MNFRSLVELLFSNKSKVLNNLIAHDKKKNTTKYQEL